MKKTIYAAAAAALAAVVLTTGCAKDDYLRYDSGLAAIRFTYAAAGADSTVYSFGLHPGQTEGTVEVPFRLIGLSSPQEREVAIEVVPESTTAREGTDYTILPCSLGADSIRGRLRVALKKDGNLTEGTRQLTVRLCANSAFSEPPVSQNTFRIIISNEVSRPDGWVFDTYSRIKHEFVIRVTGVATGYSTVWSNADRVYWQSVLINALYEYNREHPGQPLTDENGLLVSF